MNIMNTTAKVFKTAAVLWMVCLCFNLLGQQMWSLQRCIGYALQNNLQIKQQELALKQAGNNVLQSKLGFAPTLGATAQIYAEPSKAYGVLNAAASGGVTASLPIVNSFAKMNGYRSCRTQQLISMQDIERLGNEISISITQAFLQVLLSIEIEACADSSYNSVQEQVSRVEKMVDAGSQAYSTLLEIKAQLANEKVQLITARNNVRSNTLNLVQLLDLQSYENFKVEYPNIDALSCHFDSEGIDHIYNCATGMPQIKSAELALKKSKYDYRIQIAELFPCISLSGNYQIQNFKGIPSVGVSINIPIFNGWKIFTAARNARLEVENMKLELRKSHQQLFKEITLAYNNARNAYEKYLAAGANMEASKESFSYIVKKFDAGMLNSTDYIVAKANLFQSQSEYLQAKFQYVFQLKILDFYKGIPIKL